MSESRLISLQLPSHGKAAELPRQPDAERLYRRVRNLLRHYSVRDLVATALAVVWREQSSPDAQRQLRAFTWHILLCVKWALQDHRTTLEKLQPVPVPERLLSMLRQTLYTHANHFSIGASNKIAMLRSYSAVQIEYPRPREPFKR